jgi:hypothetical protein
MLSNLRNHLHLPQKAAFCAALVERLQPRFTFDWKMFVPNNQIVHEINQKKYQEILVFM